MNHGERIRVLVAHGDSVVRAGLSVLLAASPDIEVLAHDDGAGAPRAHMVVTDHRDGIARVRPAPGQHAAAVLVLTQHDREWEVRSAMMAGVHGYLLQNCSHEQLMAAVRAVSQGQRYLSAELSCCIVDSFSRNGLTNRETDVLQLLAQGFCNKLIARELGIGLGTVKTHVKGLFDKLGATARTHAVAVARRRGLIGDSQQDAPRQLPM